MKLFGNIGSMTQAPKKSAGFGLREPVELVVSRLVNTLARGAVSSKAHQLAVELETAKLQRGLQPNPEDIADTQPRTIVKLDRALEAWRELDYFDLLKGFDKASKGGLVLTDALIGMKRLGYDVPDSTLGQAVTLIRQRLDRTGGEELQREGKKVRNLLQDVALLAKVTEIAKPGGKPLLKRKNDPYMAALTVRGEELANALGLRPLQPDAQEHSLRAADQVLHKLRLRPAVNANAPDGRQ